MRIFAILARGALGLLFLYAAWDKIADPEAFATIIRNYQILPDNLVNASALLLPWVEVVCGVCLLTGFLPRGASLLVCGLLVVFLSALVYAYHKGLSTQCGCFTTKPEEGAISVTTLLRDSGLLVWALFVAVDAFLRRDAV